MAITSAKRGIESNISAAIASQPKSYVMLEVSAFWGFENILDNHKVYTNIDNFSLHSSNRSIFYFVYYDSPSVRDCLYEERVLISF